MFRLEDLTVFVRAAEAGNLSAAARALDCSPAVASAALARLESALGQRLLLRSTRSARLSPAGERFLPHAIEALRALEEGRASLVGDGASLRGQLRVSAPSDLGRNLLRAWLDEFQALHPALTLRLQTGDRLSNLFREPVDVALRYGSPNDESLFATALAPDNRRITVASPVYLAQHGTPASPDELIQHLCLRYTVGDRTNDHWTYSCDGQTHTVAVAGNRVAEDGDVVRRWAVDGHGIACLSQLDVACDIAAGRLVHLFPNWVGEQVPLYLVCAQRSSLSPTITALRLYLRTQLANALSA